MKQLIALTCSGALTAASVASRPETLATKTLNRRLQQERELVLLDIDGTVVAREINLAPHAGVQPVFVRSKSTPIYTSPDEVDSTVL